MTSVHEGLNAVRVMHIILDNGRKMDSGQADELHIEQQYLITAPAQSQDRQQYIIFQWDEHGNSTWPLYLQALTV